jgi:hypothetical protein
MPTSGWLCATDAAMLWRMRVLPGLGRRDDQTALPASERGDDVDRATGDAVTVGRSPLAGLELEDQALGRIQRHAELLHVAQDL